MLVIVLVVVVGRMLLNYCLLLLSIQVHAMKLRTSSLKRFNDAKDALDKSQSMYESAMAEAQQIKDKDEAAGLPISLNFDPAYLFCNAVA